MTQVIGKRESPWNNVTNAQWDGTRFKFLRFKIWHCAMRVFSQSELWLLVPGPLPKGQIILEQQSTSTTSGHHESSPGDGGKGVLRVCKNQETTKSKTYSEEAISFCILISSVS